MAPRVASDLWPPLSGLSPVFRLPSLVSRLSSSVSRLPSPASPNTAPASHSSSPVFHRFILSVSSLRDASLSSAMVPLRLLIDLGPGPGGGEEHHLRAAGRASRRAANDESHIPIPRPSATSRQSPQKKVMRQMPQLRWKSKRQKRDRYSHTRDRERKKRRTEEEEEEEETDTDTQTDTETESETQADRDRDRQR